MAEFITPGMLGRRADNFCAEDRAKRIWERASAAVRLSRPQPYSTLVSPLPTGCVLAYLLTRAGLPRSRAAVLLRVSELGIAALVAEAKTKRRDPPIEAWLDELVEAMPSFHDVGEVA